MARHFFCLFGGLVMTFVLGSVSVVEACPQSSGQRGHHQVRHRRPYASWQRKELAESRQLATPLETAAVAECLPLAKPTPKVAPLVDKNLQAQQAAHEALEEELDAALNELKSTARPHLPVDGTSLEAIPTRPAVSAIEPSRTPVAAVGAGRLASFDGR